MSDKVVAVEIDVGRTGSDARLTLNVHMRIPGEALKPAS